MKLEVYGSDKSGYHAHGQSDTEHLEPCPFCGSEEITVQNTHSPSYWAECENCGAHGPGTTYPRREARSRAGVKSQHESAFNQAVWRWNSRVA